MSNLFKRPDEALWHPLTPEQAFILEKGGTEKPYSGHYNLCFERGVYFCCRCDTALYSSDDKIDSHNGWPTFRKHLPRAVNFHPDPSGDRPRDIACCANCLGRIGTRYVGEELTLTNERHIINSCILNFIERAFLRISFPSVIFTGGDFRGLQYYMSLFQGVMATQLGYISGRGPRPSSYEQILRGESNYRPCVEVFIDPKRSSVKTIIQNFCEIHDPSTPPAPANSPARLLEPRIYVRTPEAREAAEEVLESLRPQFPSLTTKICSCTDYYEAEEKLHNYFFERDEIPTSHRRIRRFY